MFIRKEVAFYNILSFSFVVVFLFSLSFGGAATKFLLIYIIIYIYMLALTTDNKVFIITSIFISTYFMYLVPYYFWGYGYATRDDYQVSDVADINLHYLVVFVFVFLLGLYGAKKKEIKIEQKLENFENIFLYFISISVLVFFVLLSVDLRGTALTMSYQEITESRYPFIDYALVFCLMAYIFGPSKNERKLTLLICMAYVVVSLLYGLRLRSIQMLMMLFVLYFEPFIKPKLLLLITFVGIVGMQLWGELRIGENAFQTRDYIIVSNQGGVFLNANMYIGLVRDGYISGFERLTTFLGNFLAIFYSQTALPERFNLASLASSFFSIPGGGLISGYMYVWGGVFGLALGTVFISMVYRLMFSMYRNQYFIVYGLIIICTFPRWFAYSPIHFFKMAVWSVFLYSGFLLAHKIMKRKVYV